MFAYLALPSCSLLLTYDTSLAIRFLSFKPGKQLFCLNKSGLRNDISSKTRAAIPILRFIGRVRERTRALSQEAGPSQGPAVSVTEKAASLTPEK